MSSAGPGPPEPPPAEGSPPAPDAAPPAGRVLSATPAALTLASFSALAALLVLTGQAPALAAALTMPALLGGVGLAILPRWSAGEPSLLKVGVVAWLVSPPLFAALLGGLSLVLPPERALAATLGLIAVGQLGALGVGLGAAPPGRAAWCAVLAGPLLAAAVLWAYAAAPVLAYWGDGLWWAGTAAELAGPPPYEDPWLAGTPLRQAIGPALLLCGFARALALEPSAALGLLVAWPLAALPLVLYFIAAPLWREPRRVLAAAALGLVGGGAGAGLWTLTQGAALEPVEGFAPFLRALVAAPHAGPHGLPLAPLALTLVPGAGTAAWGLAVLALMAAVHALRHGRRPWVGLAGLAVGLTLSLDLALGLAAAGAIALTALLAPACRSFAQRILLVLAGWVAVGLAVQHGSVPRGAELGALGGPGGGPLALGLGLLALGSLALLAARPRAALEGPLEPAEEGRPTVAWLLVAAALTGGALAWLDRPAGLVPGSAALLAQAALGVLAGGALIGALSTPGPLRWLGSLWGALMLLGLVLAGGRLGAAWSQARALEPLETLEEDLREAPYPGGPWGPTWPPQAQAPDPEGLARDRALAWRRLAQRAGSIEPPPVLVLGETQEAQRLRHAPAPHPAPLLARVPLWTDRSVPHLRGHARLEPRLRAVRELYEERTALGRALMAELSELDRSALLWVDSADRERSRDLDGRLSRLGFHPLFETGQVTLYRWTPPRAVAEGRAR